MSFRKGIVPQQQIQDVKPTIPTARTIQPKIITRDQKPSAHRPIQSRITTDDLSSKTPVRGMLVGSDGKFLKGLSQATVEAHKAHTETASEQCRNCGDFKTPAQMITTVANAYNANNPLRICNECAQRAYKDPRNEKDKWQPKIPEIRFDRERANPYFARDRGITMVDLVNRDTYHEERDVAPQFRVNNAERAGQWSGGGRAGHVVTSSSLEQSRERANRVRR